MNGVGERMNMTYLQATSFLQKRGGLALDARKHTSLQLRGLATTAAGSKHILVLKHSECLSVLVQMAIAKAAGTYVVFDFE